MPTPKRIMVSGGDTSSGQAGVAVHAGRLVFTAVGQAIIDAVEEHKFYRTPIWLMRVYRKLKEQRGELAE